MANEEHLKILKQGVKAWNAWREEHLGEQPDLSSADLRDAYLSGADLRYADLRDADLSGADLRGADLRDTDLSGADLRGHLGGADLRKSCLYGADLRAHLRDALLRGANLRDANLRDANLWDANLRDARLCGADLSGADLSGADLSHADLSGTDLSLARLRYTGFGFNDLLKANGLESIQHDGPSRLGSDVIHLAQGKLPEVFLRGCGLSDWEIEAAKLHNPNLTEDERTSILYEMDRLQGQQPIQLNPLFISYSSADAPFVEALEPRFDELGVRFWRDIHDLKAGRLETQIDRAIRLNPTVLLVLSERSVESDWVEWEVGQARKLEKELKRDVLCPVALDDKWKSCSWPGPLRRQIEDYHVLDFSAWEDAGSFEGQFGKLLEGLKLFYRQR